MGAIILGVLNAIVFIIFLAQLGRVGGSLKGDLVSIGVTLVLVVATWWIEVWLLSLFLRPQREEH